MNACIDMIRKAEKEILSDKKFKKALEEWHREKGTPPSGGRNLDFKDWLRVRIDDMAGCIGDFKYAGFRMPHVISEALRVNAVGDVNAIREASLGKKAGFATDINCYVQEGIVYANVYVEGTDAIKVHKRADMISRRFAERGYSAEVWVDEEDERCVTVSAEIDFPIYLRSGNALNR